jgi:hypothetical protein
LIDLILGDPRLDLLENGLALGQFQAEIVGINSIDLPRYCHEVTHLQRLPIRVGRLQPHRPFDYPGHLLLPSIN